MIDNSIGLLLPIFIVAAGALSMMLASTAKGISIETLQRSSVVFIALAFIVELPQYGMGIQRYILPHSLGRAFVVDDFSILFDLMFLAGAALTLLINGEYLHKRRYYNGEFFSIFLFTLLGMMTLSHSNELISAFVALEIASLGIYTLSGYHKNHLISAKAMMKYLILGSFASTLFLVGSAIIYATLGTTVISEFSMRALERGYIDSLALVSAGMLIISTILFKIGAVPFHAWVTDVYEGAPFPVTMYMAAVFKIAVFALAIRLYISYDSVIALHQRSILEFVSAATLIGGSLLALRERNLKRMLAGSSIVHGGYMLIAFTALGNGSQIAGAAIIFYLFSYFISSVGAFGILSYLAVDRAAPPTYEDFEGFAKKRPYMAAMMAIFMLSLSGFPSTIGFLGKFYIFSSAVEANELWLAGLGIFTAFVSVYYYFRLIAVMYFHDRTLVVDRESFGIDTSTLLIALMAVMAVWGGIGTALIPLLPGADTLIETARNAISSLL